MNCPACAEGRAVAVWRGLHCDSERCTWRVCKHLDGRAYVVDTRNGRAFPAPAREEHKHGGA